MANRQALRVLGLLEILSMIARLRVVVRADVHSCCGQLLQRQQRTFNAGLVQGTALRQLVRLVDKRILEVAVHLVRGRGF